jgi:serine/threonine-protein kinase
VTAAAPRAGPRVAPRSAGLLASGSTAPDLVLQSARRLELASVFVIAAFGVVLALNNLGRTFGWYSVPRPPLHNLIGAAMIGVSTLVLWLARRPLPQAGRLQAVGLAYEVVVAFGISLGDHLGPLSSERPMEAISWLCVWIVMFPLVVPATLGKTLAASLLAASTWPLSFFVGQALGGHAKPAAEILALNFLENYLAAALALVPSLVLRRLGAEVQRAREMGSYELVERLDGGGMGEIWRARHKMLARAAAIKLIRPELLGGRGDAVADTLVRRFEREAQATAALHSPHTIELFDFGVTRDGTFYYVMELLDGIDLETLVRRFGPVPAERAVHFLLQACDSLADAHHAGLVHRDVKPANLYACRKGLRFDFLKVLDFGLVKASWAEAAADARLTGEAIGGTPAYLAPEIARGAPLIDGRADLYALGCVGYWLLTGSTVFDGQTPLQVVLQHVEAAPVPPSRRSELDIPAELECVILACLEKDPARRPESAGRLAESLEACRLAQPWTPERARRWWETHLPDQPRAKVSTTVEVR